MYQKIKHFSLTTSIVLSVCISLLIILLQLIGIFEPIELDLFDLYYKLAPNEARDERIVLIGITEDDIAKLRTNRLSDWQLYQILSELKKGNPAAVGIDIFRDHPVPPNYWELQELQKQGIDALNSAEPFGNQEFLSIFYNNPNFFAVGKQAGIKGDKDFDLISPPAVPRTKIADIGVVIDPDGTQRRGLLFPITKEPAVPSLSWALAQRYLEQQKAKIETIERNNELHIKINHKMFWKFRNYTGAYVRADEGGYQVLLNWRKSDFKVVSVSDILEDKVNPLVFKDRIVIIGAYAPSLNDQFLTPLNSEWFGSPRRIYGIEAIAQVSSYILAAVLDGRSTLQTWREPWISFAILTCGLITGYFFRRIPLEQLNVSLGLILLIDISLFGLFYQLLSIGYWFSILPLILVISLTATFHYIIRTTLKRKSDDEQQKDYSRKLENMIEKRQHYRLVYNSFLSLGEKIAQPLQSLLLSNQRWIEYEELFISFLDKINISDVEQYKFKKIIAQLMIDVSKAKEFTKIIIDQFSTSIPNLSHLNSETKLIEANIALKKALEEIRDIYLDNNDLTIDIKSFITIEDTRTQNNYIETHHLKSLLISIFDQPILDCYLQEKSLPNINITLSAEDKIVYLKIFIFAAYKPNEQSLYSCEEIIKYNDGNITILAKNDYIVWDVSFISK